MKRSLLFLPGNNPAMLINGDVLGADAIILDLEDAVSPDEKDAARILVANALQSLPFTGVDIVVRINPLDENGLWREDLDRIVPLRPDCILAPKVNSEQDVNRLSSHISAVEKEHDIPGGSVGLIALLETACGIENSAHIACSDPRLKGLFLGAEDLTADLRCERTKEGAEIAYARSRVVYAARAAGIDAYDTPFTDVYDDEGIVQDARLARSLGFSGKAAISPRHVGAINQAFSPTREEVEYAHEVMEAIATAKAKGLGAISLYGKMIDLPIVLRAKNVLAMEQALGGDLD